MADDPVSLLFREQVNKLRSSVAPGVAEELALAMVSGAAEAFLELAEDDKLGRSPERRLLDVLPFDVHAALWKTLA